MKSGNDELVELLESAMKDADWLELQLPHIADRVRTLVKYVKAYDKNQKAFIKWYLENRHRVETWQKVLNLMQTYLTPQQRRFAKKYAEELEHDTE